MAAVAEDNPLAYHIHDFVDTCVDTLLTFRVIRAAGTLFIWVGSSAGGADDGAALAEQQVPQQQRKQAPVYFTDLSVAMPARASHASTGPATSTLSVEPQSTPIPPAVAHLLGSGTSSASEAMAGRLALKTKKQVFVSLSLPSSSGASTSMFIERRIVEEMKQRPEQF
ncbi:hypothetical protein CAOG_01888 [Capsaspora owczarzaki ATCC 30864]|nr:hypothetical protein CAOG_01888 [Capsaspora owczarzaki ATCC 30864]|eukprot:XP_004364756.1 hypothetical protein CAOG_01888 [Capsaspora owczarzaki ATCC 30864]